MATAAASKEPEIDDLEPVADETANQARKVVASYSTDADECRMLLDMLGIGPEPQVTADAE
ncbi:hypothetical protein [Dietzia sp. ANT_WB102]|uniref:hypothetical protein n=1 Tax=Dietzia sp. ANT_WB102 TaxID=2597345 RepID=UPI0011EFE3C3|nr:hypothetical protein [Dietzia sp. ANT_WB102]KAA0916526.1 hypothetical protein FQ137_15045 [Dietzia sp. ANT_WB102]